MRLSGHATFGEDKIPAGIDLGLEIDPPALEEPEAKKLDTEESDYEDDARVKGYSNEVRAAVWGWTFSRFCLECLDKRSDLDVLDLLRTQVLARAAAMPRKKGE